MKISLPLLPIFAFTIILAFVSCEENQKTRLEQKHISTRKITWDDFQGKPNMTENSDAYASWEVKYKYKIMETNSEDLKIDFQVWNDFNKEKSWVKKEALKKDYADELLIHEQGHFYFGALCASELKRRFSEEAYNKSNYKAKIKEIFNEVFSKYKDMDDTYDYETNHMLNKKGQSRWNKFFEVELKKIESK